MSPSRLRSGEWLAALAAVVLLVSLITVHWYGPHGLSGWWSYPPVHPRRIYTYRVPHGVLAALRPRTGWQALTTLRWPLLVSGLLGLGLAAAQAARRGPALAVSLDLIAMLVAGVTAILLLVELASTDAPLRFGAVLGMLGIAGVAAGAYQAMRAEQGWVVDAAHPVAVVDLGSGPDLGSRSDPT